MVFHFEVMFGGEKKSRISTNSKLDEYGRIDKEHISYSFPYNFGRVKAQRKRNNDIYQNGKCFRNYSIETDYHFPCTDSSKSDKSLGGDNNDNIDQRHFSANLGDVQLALYLKINQLKYARARQSECKSQHKVKLGVYIQETFYTSQSNALLPLCVVVSDKTGTNRNTNNTDPNKLLKSGDVESNPGPTPTNTNSQKGRPKKKGFKGTPVKSPISHADAAKFSKAPVDCIENHSSTSIDNTSGTSSAMPMLRNNPIGLTNSGENICFLNCVVQILYFIPALHTRLYEYSSRTLIRPLTYDQHVRFNVMTSLKLLFDEISNGYSEVRSSRYFDNLKIYSTWRLGQQQDSHEFLDHILNNLYPKLENFKLEDDCIF